MDARSSPRMTLPFSSSEEQARRLLVKIVIAGLEPAIHHLRKTLAKIDGCAVKPAHDASIFFF
jgi:hypothetical protein